MATAMSIEEVQRLLAPFEGATSSQRGKGNARITGSDRRQAGSTFSDSRALDTGKNMASALAHWIATGQGRNGDSNAIYTDMIANGTAKYAPYFEGFAEWWPREQARANASGWSDGLLGSLIPTVMGAVTGNPMMGALVGAAQQGVATGGNVLAMLGGAGAGYGGAKLVPKVTQGVQNALNTILGVTTPNPLAGNAVPGIRTGVTTPAGGAAITGAGKAAPLVGLQGGAPLGASSLAAGASSGGSAPPNFFAEVARTLGDQASIMHKTRPGASFNALQMIQPIGAYG